MYFRYDEGTIIAENAEAPPEHFEWDSRIEKWRTLALYYPNAINQLRENGIQYTTTVPRYKTIQPKLKLDFDLHDYQKEGLQAWTEANCLGTVILPTGAGKTFLALKAIEHVKRSTLIIVPTIDLLNQWYDLLTNAFELEIGILGGGYHEIQEITVTTYDSAYRYSSEYGNRFGFLIFDEVHHLPSPYYSHIPELSIASRRLGLTATYERSDGMELALRRLIGDVVYRKSIDELRGEYLSEYETVRLYVELTEEEREEYDRERALYINFLRNRNIQLFGGGWGEFVRLSTQDSEARRAMLALNRSKTIALEAAAKLELLESLLKQHCQARVLIFTESNRFAYKISMRHLLPVITHQTKTKERKRILERFNTGEYPAIVTSKVLNEGVNVPDANIGIVLSGSGSTREYIQRLGRILRKREGKYAILYEVVTRDTLEKGVSQRRRRRTVKPSESDASNEADLP
ncbi:MAG: DEAD/DEAH box helicase family protein [Candidatus Poribacteria bacterium]|nr:DEAD/DEAH box helicase family protein [Candidatus Poribacteria bacterium]